MASQTDPLEVVVFVAAALRKREDVIDLNRFGLIANSTYGISSEDLGAELSPSMPSSSS